MAIVKIEKENKNNENNSYNRQQEVLPGVSLNLLNNSNEDYKFDFGNNSAGMNNGKLKNEIGITSACVKTAISSFVKLGVFLALIFIIIKYVKIDIDLTWFDDKAYLTKDMYWDEFLRVSLMLGLSLLIICFMNKLFINGSIRKTLKKNYLNKMNIYIYDGFIAVLNVVSYVIICIIYFVDINNTFDKIEKLESVGKIIEGIDIELFNLLKYGVVIIVSVFIALNIFRGVSIIYKKNKFVFEEQL